jgi:PPE-repeat protein
MKSLALIAAVLALSACSKPPEPQQQAQVPAQQQVYQQAPVQQAPVQYVQQPQPVIVQQDSGIGNLATGMLLGHMMSGGGGGGNVTRNTTVVNKTVVNKTYVRPSAAPTRSSSSRRK